MLFSAAVCNSKGELQYTPWPSKSSTIFPAALCLSKCPANQMMTNSVLLYDDFRLAYKSDAGGKPSPISCSLLVSLCISTRAEIDLQHSSVLSL
jgi:hypothetical protein